MESKTTKDHQNASSKDITCGIITLSDSRSKKEDLSGDYLENEINERYTLKSRLSRAPKPSADETVTVNKDPVTAPAGQ